MLDRIATTQHRQVDSGGSAFVLLHKYTYAYDDQSRFESIDSTEDGLSEFSYDQIGQLTDADHAVSRPDEAYAFDETGNRTGGTTIDDGNLLVDDGTFDYVYDKNGNRIEKSNSSTGETWEYDWDHRNRLFEVTYDSTGNLTVTTTLDYDVFNRLVHVEESDPNTSTTRDKYFAGFDEYDDATLTFDGDTAGDLLDRILTHRGEVFAQENRLLNGTADSNVLWGLNDHLGTARDIARYLSTSSLFEVVDTRVYDSFGNLTSGGTATDFAFGFTGQLVDVGADIDLNYHHNRWYDASTGRWISDDPIGFAAGDVNVQRYVGNNALSFVDTDGLVAMPVSFDDDADQGRPIGPQIGAEPADSLSAIASKKMGDQFWRDWEERRNRMYGRGGPERYWDEYNDMQAKRALNRQLQLEIDTAKFRDQGIGNYFDNSSPLNMHAFIGAVGGATGNFGALGRAGGMRAPRGQGNVSRPVVVAPLKPGEPQGIADGTRTQLLQQPFIVRQTGRTAPKWTVKDFPTVGAKTSQKQLRHIKGRSEYRGGGFFDDVADAQKVLDDFNAGNATIIGKTRQGFPVVRVEGVTGTNVNISAGFPNQPTNEFIIKGTKSPSVVPANPNWGG